MSTVGREAAFPQLALKTVPKKPEPKDTANWIDNSYAFEQAAEAGRLFLEKIHPRGASTMPNFRWLESSVILKDDVVGSLEKYERDRARLHVEELIRKAKGKSEKKIFAQAAEIMRGLAPDLCDRAKEDDK